MENLTMLEALFLTGNAKKYRQAGFINAEGKITSDGGVKAIQRVVFEQFEKHLVKLADEQIAQDTQDAE